MPYNCDIIANNNTDFVIANNITSGTVPALGGGGDIFVANMNFDIDECCKNNASFRVKLRKTEEALKTSSSLQEKFEIMQNFMNETMPLCDPQKIRDRDVLLIFYEKPFSYFVEHQMTMCLERATMAQFLCQKCGIKSYLTNSCVDIKNGEQGQHAYVIFEDNNQMFVYDPANPTKNNAPRIMSANMDKTIFNDFVDAVNHNADCDDKKQKNCVGFVCNHEDGKIFLYRSFCGTEGNKVTLKKLKEARIEKAVAANRESQSTGKINSM